MPQKTILRTLVYKRTHKGDPNRTGCFGIRDCMGRLRNTAFEAVIGIGGSGVEPEAQGISCTVNWIGVGARKTEPDPKEFPLWRGPLVTFDHFVLFDEKGPDFRVVAPALARRMYSARPPRRLFDDFNKTEQAEIRRLLKMAETAPPSTATLRAIRFRRGPKCC
jgi:hypothetical protein